jgi:hypothetical protein
MVQLGARQARYFGRAKVAYQISMIATVANLMVAMGALSRALRGASGQPLSPNPTWDGPFSPGSLASAIVARRTASLDLKSTLKPGRRIIGRSIALAEIVDGTACLGIPFDVQLACASAPPAAQRP